MPELTPPPWVQAKEGVPESLKTNKASKEELVVFLAEREEAQFMHNTQGRVEMSEQQKFLIGAIQLETVARANLELADKLHPKLIAEYERMLATALHQQGRNEEAMNALTQLDSKSQALAQRIIEVQAAIEKDDAELHSHNCKRRVEDNLEFDRRYAEVEVFSLRHGQLVHLHRCTECEEWNATPDVPERQRDRAEMRLNAQAIMITAKEAVNLRHYSDAQLLKSNAAV